MTLLDNNRGVSEILGFAIIFGIILLSVSLLYLTGLGGLNGYKEEARLSNGQRAMDVVHGNIEDVYLHNAPSRTTEVKLSETQIGMGDPVSVRVNVSGSTVYDRAYKPIEYRAERGDIVYANGGLYRQERTGDAILEAAPAIQLKDNTARVVLVRTVGTAQVGGSSTLRVVTAQSNQGLANYTDADNTPVEVTIETNEKHARVLRDYYTEKGWSVGSETNLSNGVLQIETVKDEVIVRYNTIFVSVES